MQFHNLKPAGEKTGKKRKPNQTNPSTTHGAFFFIALLFLECFFPCPISLPPPIPSSPPAFPLLSPSLSPSPSRISDDAFRFHFGRRHQTNSLQESLTQDTAKVHEIMSEEDGERKKKKKKEKKKKGEPSSLLDFFFFFKWKRCDGQIA